MAKLHKRKLRSGRIVWVLTHGTGKERQRFVAGRTREEAEEIFAKFKRQLALHGGAPERASLEWGAAEYSKYLATNRRPRTKRRYDGILRTFIACFIRQHHPQVQALRDIKPSHVEEYKRRRMEGGIVDVPDPSHVDREGRLRKLLREAPSSAKDPRANAKFGFLGRRPISARVTLRTVNYELRVLFTFFQWAVRRNMLFVNPSAGIERLRIPKRALPKFMTSDDLKKFFAACPPGARRLYMAILLTGMRRGEAEYLQWDDVSMDLGVIFIREKVDIGWQPKTNERIIPISPVLRDVLAAQLVNRTSDKWVFANIEGNRDTHMLERLKRICVRAGIRIATVHALRHSFGAHLRMAGVSLADIADLLGHQDLATTQIYAKVHQEHLRQAVAKLAPLVEDTSDQNRTNTKQLVGGQHATLVTALTDGNAASIAGAAQCPDPDEEAGTEGDGNAGKAG